MGKYGNTYATDGTSALQMDAHPYLRLVTEDTLAENPPKVISHVAPEKFESRSGVAGRIAALAVTLAVFAIAMTISDAAIASRRASIVQETSFERVTVVPGDSLWDIAADHGIEGCDTAEVVRVIEERNGLGKGELTPGQSIAVPARNS